VPLCDSTQGLSVCEVLCLRVSTRLTQLEHHVPERMRRCGKPAGGGRLAFRFGQLQRSVSLVGSHRARGVAGLRADL
jgi:hypothetical protein